MPLLPPGHSHPQVMTDLIHPRVPIRAKPALINRILPVEILYYIFGYVQLTSSLSSIRLTYPLWSSIALPLSFHSITLTPSLLNSIIPSSSSLLNLDSSSLIFQSIYRYTHHINLSLPSIPSYLSPFQINFILSNCTRLQSLTFIYPRYGPLDELSITPRDLILRDGIELVVVNYRLGMDLREGIPVDRVRSLDVVAEGGLGLVRRIREELRGLVGGCKGLRGLRYWDGEVEGWVWFERGEGEGKGWGWDKYQFMGLVGEGSPGLVDGGSRGLVDGGSRGLVDKGCNEEDEVEKKRWKKEWGFERVKRFEVRRIGGYSRRWENKVNKKKTKRVISRREEMEGWKKELERLEIVHGIKV
ncbi:hypothetical protein QBC38DRAFT_460500 [Podospora fimiseda]|uniref:F-box domain-containing protein n=1 Tax=Podospora fimiseda TaxID=252190 RepID=A0AAN6YPM3_9PEZI|nr:hypothetical protein QBC38DRAFT_460500 [Podospora fimiseda]